MSDETQMRVYLVTRTDPVDYDEFDAFVVVARDPDDARSVVGERLRDDDWSTRQRDGFAAADVVEIDATRRGEVLGSFNAG